MYLMYCTLLYQDGNTPLVMASLEGNESVVDVPLRDRTEVNMANKVGAVYDSVCT